MKAGTTEPCRSEDLWVQVERPSPKVRTQRRGALLVNARSKAGANARDGPRECRGSDLSVARRDGRLQIELRGA